MKRRVVAISLGCPAGVGPEVAVLHIDGTMSDGESLEVPIVGAKLAGSKTLSRQIRALREHMEVNYLGATQLLEVVLPTLLAAGCGHVSLMASVAGYRGLPKALAYGPTKAALNNLAEILYLDLHDRGLGVSVINPGFVDTPMTAGNDFAMPALMQPDAAARAILAGWAAGRYEMHFPRRFTLLMKLLRHLGERSYFFAVRRVTQP